MNSPEQSCCFIGHRKVENAIHVTEELKTLIKNLIIEKKIRIFLFGSRSEFNDICLQVVTELNKIYPDLIRIYIRAEYKFIDENYKNYLLLKFDNTYFSVKAENATKLVYIKRNEELIDNSKICIFYYKTHYPTSGTAIALKYAKSHNKNIITIA